MNTTTVIPISKKGFREHIRTLSLIELNELYDRLIRDHIDLMWLFQCIEDQEENLLREERRHARAH